MGDELATNPKVRKLTFTGSTEVGKQLMAKCTGTVKRVSMELGGHAPFLVFADADLDKAADAMLARFNTEHWHDEDEVRLIIEGRGVFHVHPAGQPVLAIEVGPGDLIRVPAGIHHWFDLCSDRTIRAIRLFQDPAGWVPAYSESDLHQKSPPVDLT